MIRVVLPTHLRNLARIEGEVVLERPPSPATAAAILDAIEARYPMLRGTIRDQATRKRRPFVRYFASGQDISHEPETAPLPAAVAEGDEPLLILGAIAGG